MAKAERTAVVVWEGNLARGKGSLDTGSGAMEGASIDFPARTERPDGKTSPEELIAAAHAGCYAMALSNTLSEAGSEPGRLNVGATCTLDMDTLKITTVHLTVRGNVPGMDAEGFQTAAEQAEQTCPVSNALRGNVEINLDVVLEGD